MPLSHYDHEFQESPRIDKFQDSWGFVIPLLHFVKFLPVSYIFVVSSD